MISLLLMASKVLPEVHELVKKSNLPTFVTPMGKSAVDESVQNYGGVYAGDGSGPGVREKVESSDLILSIGALKSDFNTGGFTYKLSQLNMIEFHSSYVNVRYSGYPGVQMKGVLRKVIDQMDLKQLSLTPGPRPANLIRKSQEDLSGGEAITQSYLWPRLGQWLRKNDIVVTETGTSSFGIWETRFPEGVTAVSQVLWGSIGYSVGATQGAALAASDMGVERRTILFVGDGSFQLTAQEVSTMIRLKLKPIM